MRIRTLLIACMVITAGAWYGRYRFLQDRGLVDPSVTFVDYVLRGKKTRSSKRTPKESRPAAAKSEKKPAPVKKPSSERTDSTAGGPEPGGKREPAVVLEEAKGEMSKGNFDRARALLSALSTPPAAELRYKAALLSQLVSDVEVDPGAHAATIHAVRLSNGNTLYAVSAEEKGELWNLTLANGIKCGLPRKDVAEVRPEEPEKFRRERLSDLEARLSEMTSRGVFDKLKAVRLAWRRGFPPVAWRIFEDLSARPKALEALEVLLPPEKAVLLAQVRKKPASQSEPPGGEVGPEESTPAAGVGPSSPPPPSAVRRGEDAGAFASIDRKISEAQKKIHAALSLEGAESDKLVKEAGKLLVEVRRRLQTDSSLPRGDAYRRRLHKVTLILDDFLKISSFGLSPR